MTETGPATKRRISLVHRWQQLKRQILSNRWINESDLLRQMYKELFAQFDQGLARRLVSVDRAAEAAADGDARSVGRYRRAVVDALATVETYQARLAVFRAEFNERHDMTQVGIGWVERVLEDTRIDLVRTEERLDRG